MKEDFFDKLSGQEFIDAIVNLNRMLLNRKSHVKKYNKIRKLHSEIINNMNDYMFTKYDLNKVDSIVLKEIKDEIKGLNIFLDSTDIDDITVMIDLYVYNNHKSIPSITDIYLEKKKFRNEEKIKLLKAMKNSHVGLFKIVKADRENGFVTLEDVFTKEKFKIIDISLSTTFNKNNKEDIYMYNRIITVDDISFGTGIHCMITSSNKELIKFIKNHKYKKCSDFARCLLLYNISKKEKNLVASYNNRY